MIQWRQISVFAGQSVEERLDRVIEILLVVLLAFGPLALGVVHAWSEQVLLLLAAAISLVFLVKLVLAPSIPFVWSWAYVPVAAFVLVVVLQLTPLPTSIVSAISSSTATIRTELLADLPDSEQLLSSMPLSFYPSATRHDLRLVLAVAAVLIIVVNVYRQPQRIKRLLTAIAAVGGAIALLALAQDVVGNGKIYWLVPTYDKAASGTFINHSHYGQFMNLSMGAALGLLLVTLREAFDQHRITPARVAEYLSSPEGRMAKVLVAMMVLGATTVFISLTRGGMISMLIAATFTTLMLSWRQSLKGPGWVMVLLTLGAFTCILYVGFDQVYNRLATLRDLHGAQAGRWQIVQDIALAWTKFPLLGVGLGTHGVVYPMFDRSTTAALAMYAENEYAQTAEETGLAGLLALGCFAVIVWVQYGRNIRGTSVPIRVAAYGLGFGLLAILIHSLSDFGQHLPANAMLSAVCCGLLIALGHTDHPGNRHFKGLPKGVAVSAARLIVLLGAVGVWGWALLGANSARIARASWNKALAAERHLEAGNWQAGPQAYDDLFTHAMAAAQAESDNIYYQHWLGVYKWLSLTPYMDPNTRQLGPEALPWARQIVDELHQARPLCPTFGALYCVVGEIEKFVLGDPNGTEQIRKGYRLAPCDPTVCLVAARVDIEEGRTADAFAKLVRSVQLDESGFEQAALLCINDLDRADLALKLAEDKPARLARVGSLLTSLDRGSPDASATADALDASEHQELIERVRSKAFEQLKRMCDAPDAPASAHASLASLYQQQKDYEAAIQHYRRAVQLDYDQFYWHYNLAALLAKVGRNDQAIHEVRICLRIRPDCAPAKRLLTDLIARPVTPPLAETRAVAPERGK